MLIEPENMPSFTTGIINILSIQLTLQIETPFRPTRPDSDVFFIPHVVPDKWVPKLEFLSHFSRTIYYFIAIETVYVHS